MSRNKGFDPSIIFFVFILFMLTGITRLPIVVVGAIAYFIYRASQKNKERSTRDRQGRYQQRDRSRNYERPPRTRREQPDYRSTRRTPPKPKPKRNNPFKTSGINKYKDYDYDGAIEDFKKALEIDDTDLAVHFNIACAYSLTEQKDKSFYHLSKAVEQGFTDFEKIKTHDALAYIRIQDDYEIFVQNGYKWKPGASTVVEQNVEENSNLLDQLKQLAELREKGLLTQDEFELQKKKLLG